MNELSYGDFIIMQISLLQYTQTLDLSTQAGQYVSQILGKVEYQLTRLKQLSEQRPNSIAGTRPPDPQAKV